MNKITYTKERVFNSVFGPIGPGKSHFIFIGKKNWHISTKKIFNIIKLFIRKCKEKTTNLSKELTLN